MSILSLPTRSRNCIRGFGIMPPFTAKRTQPRCNAVEIALEHYSHTLSGKSRFDIEILVVVAVVGLQPYRATSIQEIFYIEIAYELVVVQRLVAIAEITVHQQTVIQQMAGQRQIHLHIRKIALIAPEIRRYIPVVAQLAEHIAELRRYC